MNIAIANRSSLLSDNVCCLISQACRVQLRDHVCPSWGRTEAHVLFVGRSEEVPLTHLPIYVLDDPDLAGAAGYHAEDPQGRAYGRAFVRGILLGGGGVLSGTTTVSTVVSHEVIEAFIDPDCQLWAERGGGGLVAYEPCDPVEGQSYAVNVNGQHVSVANFVLPTWFDAGPEAKTQYDWMSTLSGPFRVSNDGYAITFDGALEAGKDHATYAARFKPVHPSTRTWKRTNRKAIPTAC